MSEENGTMEFNKDELNPPEFLNKDFFENILQKEQNDNALKLKKLQLAPGTKAGDHFASIMFKATVSYTSKGKEVNSRSLVVKTMPVEDGLKKEMLKEIPFFDTEIKMYTKILPEMKRLMESIGDQEQISPRLIYHSTDPPTLIFEDISKDGYEMHHALFDFDNAVKILKKLAKFHALSYYMNDKKYEFQFDFTQYKSAMTEKMIDMFKVFFQGFDYFKDEVKNWPGYEQYSEKLAAKSGTFIKMLTEVYQPNPEPGLNVLCHGDFHIRNMMFVMNGLDIKKTMFLDFQICFWGSPVIDIFYILYSIGNAECRRRRGEMLFIYHNMFSDYLNRLGCLKKPPTLLDLNIEMLRMGAMEIMWSICLFPFFCVDFTKTDLDTIVDTNPENESNTKLMLYKNEMVIELVKEVLPDLVHKGIL